MRITSAEVTPVHVVTNLRVKVSGEPSLSKKVDVETKQFIQAVADSIYTQRAFIQAIKLKGSKLDIYT